MSAISDVTDRRERILAAVFQCTDRGEKVDGAAVGRMADATTKLLPDGCEYDAVYRSFTPLLGSEPTRDTLKNVAWALAANIDLLKNGTPPFPAKIPSVPTRATIQVLAARRLPQRKSGPKKPGFPVSYRGRVIAGPGCPLVIEWTWSSSYVAFISSRPSPFGLGFSRQKYGKPQTGRPYQHFTTLVGMRFSPLVSVADGRVKLDEVKCGSGLRDHNRALTEMRFRSTFACPFEFTHPCHHCPKGQSSCSAACHPIDYVTKVCAACNREADHDEFWKLGVCTRCAGDGRRALA